MMVVVLTAGCSARVPEPGGGRLEWQPELDQPIRQLREVLEATEPQQHRNYTSSNLGFVLDAKLYLLFHRYADGLDPDARMQAIDEQGRWLEKRKAATSAASDRYRGGSLASYSGNTAFIEATQDRIAEIESRMP